MAEQLIERALDSPLREKLAAEGRLMRGPARSASRRGPLIRPRFQRVHLLPRGEGKSSRRGEVKALWFSRQRISDPSLTRFLAVRNRIAQKDVPRRRRAGRVRALAMLPVPLALDALNFLSADVRNLFGPFINVYLVTGQHWSQTEVGLVTTASGLIGIALQTPIGAAIDVIRANRLRRVFDDF